MLGRALPRKPALKQDGRDFDGIRRAGRNSIQGRGAKFSQPFGRDGEGDVRHAVDNFDRGRLMQEQIDASGHVQVPIVAIPPAERRPSPILIAFNGPRKRELEITLWCQP